MKRKILSILVTGCIVLFLGCAKEPQVAPEKILYGPEDSISFRVGYLLAGVNTKSQPDEWLVEDVNLYVINELGDLVTYGYYTSPSPVQAVVLKNMEYTVYAIANAGRELPASTATAVEGMVYELEDASHPVNASGAVLMSGKSVRQSLSEDALVVIDLTRCVSRIVVKTEDLLLNPDVSITVNSVQLKNIPRSVAVFSESKISDPEAVLDGDIVKDPSIRDLAAGLVFYQYENRQGTLQPGNLDPAGKVWPADNVYSFICSYVEMQATYVSPRKRGTIVYRFYLGTDMVANYDVIRNTQHTVVVCFKGDGAVEENTWRVDHRNMVDLVMSLVLNPVSHKFTALEETVQLAVSVLPLTAHNKEIQWSSSDEKVAVVDVAGKVTAKGDGWCTITAASTDGTVVSASCSIEVDSKIYVTGVDVQPELLELYAGEQSRLVATVFPEGAAELGVLWSSSDPGIATVDVSGKISAVAAGECIVTVASKEDSRKKATCRVVVKSREFSISPLAKTLYVGESFTVDYTVVPPVVPVFVSEAPAVAAVDVSGKVTALTPGTAKIKASAYGKEACCIVTVVLPQIEFPESGRVMYDGEVVTVPYAVLVPASFVPEITTSNSLAEVVEATSAGMTIKANAAGSCLVTARVGPAVATYMLDIQLLRIVFDDPAPVKLYQGFRDPLHYTVYPAHARSLVVTLQSQAENQVKTLNNRVVQGADPSSSPVMVSACFSAFPERKYTTTCVVRPAITLLEKSLELLTGLSPYSAPVTEAVYQKYALTVDKHPGAVVTWTAPYADIQVSEEGVVVPAGTGNGKYPDEAAGSGREAVPITATVTGDDMHVYSDWVSTVVLYENALVYGEYQENTTGAVDPADPGTIEFAGRYDEQSDKLGNDDTYPYRHETVYFWDSYSYPLAHQTFAVDILPVYRRIVGRGGNTKGRYFYITTLKDTGYY